MKKVVIPFILCISLIFGMSGPIFAQDEVVENPNIKIVVDGKLGTYEDTPIIINGSTLLPLRTLLVNLGVQDDDRHIIWNGRERSITIYKETVKIYLKVGSDTAHINDKPVTLSAKPVIYKDKTYIPARFVAQSLGKAVAWDAASATVLIRDEQEYEKTKELLGKVDAAVGLLSRYRIGIDIATSMNQGGTQIDGNTSISIDVDQAGKSIYMVRKISSLGIDMNLEYYFINNAVFVKNPLSGKWEKESIAEEEYNKLFNDALSTKDVLSAGLAAADSQNPNEIVLRGDICFNELFEKVSTISPSSSVKFNRFDLEMSIDKETYLVNKFVMNVSYELTSDQGSLPVEMKLNCIYKDFNGDFEVVAPEEIQNAVK